MGGGEVEGTGDEVLSQTDFGVEMVNDTTYLAMVAPKLLKCLESFARPQSTNFGFWTVLAPLYPSRACQTCLSRLPKNRPPPVPVRSIFLLSRLFRHCVRCLSIPISLDQCNITFWVLNVVHGCNHCPFLFKHEIIAPKSTARMLGNLCF